jgi:hypothetical protein
MGIRKVLWNMKSLEIRCDISKDHSYRLEVSPPLFLTKCAVEAWHEGHQIWHDRS